MSYSIPPPEHPHTWAELLTLVGAIRRIAHDSTLAPDDAMRRIRDAFRDDDGGPVGEPGLARGSGREIVTYWREDARLASAPVRIPSIAFRMRSAQTRFTNFATKGRRRPDRG